MHQVFSVVTKDSNGDEKKREIAILHWTGRENPYYLLHRLGVEYAMSPEGTHLRNTGLTYGELFEYLTPEKLDPHGMQILWPDREAVQLADGRKIVSSYEIQSHLEAQIQEREREYQREKQVKEIAGRYARRLEHLRDTGHPVISTWAPDVIVNRAITWAYLYVRSTGKEDINPVLVWKNYKKGVNGKTYA